MIFIVFVYRLDVAALIVVVRARGLTYTVVLLTLADDTSDDILVIKDR